MHLANAVGRNEMPLGRDVRVAQLTLYYTPPWPHGNGKFGVRTPRCRNQSVATNSKHVYQYSLDVIDAAYRQITLDLVVVIITILDVYVFVQGSDQCDACEHVQNGPFCEAECPESTYADHTQTCRPCNPNCLNGCTGEANSLGEGGCNACDVVVYEEPDSSYCLSPGSRCPENFFEKFARNNWSHGRYVVSTTIDHFNASCVISHPHRMHVLFGILHLSSGTNFLIPFGSVISLVHFSAPLCPQAPTLNLLSTCLMVCSILGSKPISFPSLFLLSSHLSHGLITW